MAQKIVIQCINKSDRYNPHERIKSIGGVHDGKRWSLPEADAIAGIESGKWTFVVHVRNLEATVIIATRLGRKYLKTVADGETPDNLLSLPECP